MGKNKIIAIVGSVLVAIGILLGVYVNYKNTGEIDTEKVQEAINTVVKEVTVTEETQSIADETIKTTESGQDVSTTETLEGTEAEEKEVVDEGAIEPDAQVDQENISYDGDITGNGLNLLGAYQGLTYYSQADSRWANQLYTSTGNRTQTMKSSACGPTSASMVVSSSKGAILPTTMAQLFVSNGYRTANNGTAWSAYSFVADYFGFKDYAYTTSINTAIDYLNKGYYLIASCGSGLFTTGGHYIVIYGIDGNTLKIYDPYLYSGKFNTVSRRGKVTVSGNTVYCSIANFSSFANYKAFWCYSNDNGKGNAQPKALTSYTRYVATQSANLNVRSSEGGSVVGSLSKGTAVTVYEVSGAWSRIGANRWVSTAYLSASPVQSNVSTVSKRYSTGTYRTTANIHVRTGAGTNYKAKTYKQLTSNARSQNKRLGNYYYNGYKKRVTCTVTKVKGNWRTYKIRVDMFDLL